MYPNLNQPLARTALLGVLCGVSFYTGTTLAEDTPEEPEATHEVDDVTSPIDLMPYIEGCNGFDCDDFALTADWYLESRGFDVWQLSVYFDEDGDGDLDFGHVLNIVAVDDPNSVFAKYCLYEPQRDEVLGCWYQADGGEPELPSRMEAFMADWYWTHCGIGGPDSVVVLDDIWDDGHSFAAGEPCFTEDPEIRCAFEGLTGVEIPEGW